MATYKPGQLIKAARLAQRLRQQDVAEWIHVDRSVISQLETTGRKKPLDTDKTRILAERLKLSPLILLEAMGYDLGFADEEEELAAILPQAYRSAADREKEIVRLALGLEALPRPG